MFTGIIENTGIITEIITNNSNKTFWISSPLSAGLKADQSVSHNGVCLTVEETKAGMHRVTAIEETLLKTNLNKWQKGDAVNLERCMQLNGRLDGHIVQGHVDCIAECIEVTDKDGSWNYRFAYDKRYSALVIEKGSIAVNGISLTCFNVLENEFTVSIIPFTFEHTNMKNVKKNDSVNIEFDVIGKYVNRSLSLR